MLSVEEALAKVLNAVNVLPAQETPILDALGQVLSEDVRAEIDVPPADNSAMDGYAVRSAEIVKASTVSPVVLKVIDTVQAGSISKQTVTTGTAVRIMTGAPVPAGADTVIPFEETDEHDRGTRPESIGIRVALPPGVNIRKAGEDILNGTVVLKAGQVVHPAEVGVLASLGKATVKVYRRPIIAVLSTGNELAQVGKTTAPGQIFNSNSYSIAALVKQYGGIPKLLGIAQDVEQSMTDKIHEGLSSDLLITSGGVSMGDYDVVKDILAREGNLNFWRIRMKPGKPVAFGLIKGVPHLGLPGNPVAAMVTFELFVRPAMLKMLGYTSFEKPGVEAVVEEKVENPDGRRFFARVVVTRRAGKYFANLTGLQGSGVLTSMSRANGLLIVPEDTAILHPGDTAKVMILNWEGLL